MVIFWAYFKTLGGCTFWDDIYIIIIIIITIIIIIIIITTYNAWKLSFIPQL